MDSISKLQKLLEGASVTVNGSNPEDIQVRKGYETNLYHRLVEEGSLGLGESFMDKWWTAEKVDTFITELMLADLEHKHILNIPNLVMYVKAFLFNAQNNIKTAQKYTESHYNIGNDIYTVMLDDYMMYTCGLYRNGAKTLRDAQCAKIDLANKKMHLMGNEKILDIGTGWGGYLKRTKETYPQTKLYGIGNASNQIDYAKAAVKDASIQLCDYRETTGKYDRVVIMGMIEHIGPKNYRKLMEVAYQRLHMRGGMVLLHTITSPLSVHTIDAWINKYIFPGAVLPSVAQIAKAVEGLFVIEDVDNFGADYDKTLMAWYERLTNGWDLLKDTYDERFYLMMKYYLLSCAGGFRSRKIELNQYILTKNPRNGYIPVR